MAAKRKKTTARSTGKRPRSKRNRKLQSQGFLFPTKVAAGLVLACVVGLSYLWVCSSCESLASQIKKEEHELKQLRNKVAQEEARWTDMTGMRSLSRALKKHNLDMDWPNPEQVVHIRDMGLWIETEGRTDLYGQMDIRERPYVP